MSIKAPTMSDLVIRGGTIYDGGGGAPFVGDIALLDGMIVAVGTVAEIGREEMDASGLIVTPGFVDVHTHYDAHVTWSERLRPSSGHGVTTAVMGNCGVGFAPCRPEDRAKLITLMEGVEDIPGIVMTEGLPWAWESFPAYLDFLDGRQFDMDVAAYLPHAPLRLYVMGDRAVAREDATGDDIAGMQALAHEAVEAGALGFATSRTLNHRGSDGALISTIAAAEDELAGIAGGLARANKGIFQIISDFDDPEAEFAMIRRVAEGAGRRLTFSLLQSPLAPDRWRILLDAAEEAKAQGLPVTAQVCGRPIGVLVGLELSVNPFAFCPAYVEIAHLPFAERVAAMHDPVRRAAIIAAYPCRSWPPISAALINPDNIFLLDDRLDYEPAVDSSLGAEARRLGIAAAEHMYNLLVEGDGRAIFYIPAANFVGNSIAAVEAMMRSDVTIPGLGDGGAHCGTICDASLPTYNLLRWASEPAGPLSLAAMVRALSAECAAAVELHDRGRIAVGLRADLNLIDLDLLGLKPPRMVYDLPTGGGRLDQIATGYVATIVAGQVTYRDGEPTGALPGRLVRGARKAPLAG